MTAASTVLMRAAKKAVTKVALMVGPTAVMKVGCSAALRVDMWAVVTVVQ